MVWVCYICLSVGCLLLYDCWGWLVWGYCFGCFVALACCGCLQLLVVPPLISSDFVIVCWIGLVWVCCWWFVFAVLLF